MQTKRLLSLISLLVALSMILAACAPTTPVAQPEQPAQETEAAEQPEAPVVEATEVQPAAEATEAPSAEEEPVAAQPEAKASYKIGFLAGVNDPFYITMQRGAQQAAADLGVELVVQIPQNWNTTDQTPMLDAMVARGDLDLIFMAPVDKDAMIAPVQKANDAGVPIITVDTFIGDGDYVNGPVTFPLSFIASDNKLGGVIACEALVEAIGGKGKVYIQNVRPGISSTDAREEGCKEALAKYPDVTLAGVDYNDDDPSKAQTQVEAMLQKEPDLAGIFGTNVFSAQGAGTVVANKGLSGKVKVVAFDATATAIEMLQNTTVDMVIAQKPGDMGYFAVEMAMAYMNGVTSIPKHIPTGYMVITRDNMNDPNVIKFFYK